MGFLDEIEGFADYLKNRDKYQAHLGVGANTDTNNTGTIGNLDANASKRAEKIAQILSAQKAVGAENNSSPYNATFENEKKRYDIFSRDNSVGGTILKALEALATTK